MKTKEKLDLLYKKNFSRIYSQYVQYIHNAAAAKKEQKRYKTKLYILYILLNESVESMVCFTISPKNWLTL